MKFWNQSDFLDYENWLSRFGGSCPNLRLGWRVADQVRQHANANSDGWHSWRLPCSACGKLLLLLETRAEPSDAALRAALSPIKAFYTRIRKKVPSYPPYPKDA